MDVSPRVWSQGIGYRVTTTLKRAKMTELTRVQEPAKEPQSPELAQMSDDLKLRFLTDAERGRIAAIWTALGPEDWSFMVKVIKIETTTRNMVQFARTFRPKETA